jgi:uncharacterized Zn-finger protein
VREQDTWISPIDASINFNLFENCCHYLSVEVPNNPETEFFSRSCLIFSRPYDPVRRVFCRRSHPMEQPEIIKVDKTSAVCDGGGGPLGHPKIYLEMGNKTEIDCPYCGRQFVLSGEGAHAH